MSITRCRAWALALLALGLAGCGNGQADVGGALPSPNPDPTSSQSSSSPGDPSVPDVTGMPVPKDLGRAFTDLLDQRAEALLVGDRAAYSAGLDDAAASFVTAQEGYFNNLRQLPLETLSYRLVPASLVRTGNSYWVVVEVTSQLEGFDTVPVTTPDRFRFSPTGPRGRYRLSSTTDAEWEVANHVHNQPWDIEPVRVRTMPGVLGVFDQGTVSAAPSLMASVSQGVGDVLAQVPYEWPGTVVFYALSDDSFLVSLGPAPGGDPGTLDGVAFTVSASADDPTVASTRILLNPSILTAQPLARDRLVRHELTHVAVGDHDAHAPVWLSEGLAEWVSVQAMARQDQKVPADALAAAEAPGLTMPRDSSFNGPDADVHYAIAWWSCAYLALTYGPSMPWTLLDALNEPGAHQRKVTVQVTGLTPNALARHGAKLMVATYDPTHSPPTTPTPGSSPTTSPTASH